MIAVEDLSYGYTPGQAIVTNFSARFDPGTVTALVGKSGSGKSTLLYLLGLMINPASGRIIIDGNDTVGLPDWRRAQLRSELMGFVFQDALLDPARSVLDNVMEGSLYGPSTTSRIHRRALRLLKEFEVDVDPHRKPGQISGGQAQRVALCRAFVHDPAIVLADEPTGNLDDDTASLVWSALTMRARQGSVVIVATHDRERARRCDELVEIGHGADS